MSASRHSGRRESVLTTAALRRNELFQRQDSLVGTPTNPFVSPRKLPWHHWLKVGVVGVVLVPVRLLGLTAVLLAIALLCALSQVGQSLTERNKPRKGWRKQIMEVMPRLCRIALFFLGFHHVPVSGAIAPAMEAPILVVAPHSSFVDFLLVVSRVWASGVSRIENARIPVFGPIISSTQPIYVDRRDKESRKNTFKAIKERAKSAHYRTMIFPEGTTTNRKALITFKSGAFSAGAPVQPVLLRYHNRELDPSWTHTGLPQLRLFFLMLAQLNNYASIEFLPVYHPSAAEQFDATLFSNGVRRTMADALGVPVTEHTYEDSRLMLEAHASHLPKETGVVEFGHLKRRFGLSYDDMCSKLKSFAAMDHDADGSVTLAEFATALGLPPQDDHTVKLFDLYDRDNSGAIDFREFIVGQMSFSQPALTDETVRIAFDVFDVHKTGSVELDGVTSILTSAFPHMSNAQVRALFSLANSDDSGTLSFDQLRSFLEANPEYAAIIENVHEEREKQLQIQCEQQDSAKE